MKCFVKLHWLLGCLLVLLPSSVAFAQFGASEPTLSVASSPKPAMALQTGTQLLGDLTPYLGEDTKFVPDIKDILTRVCTAPKMATASETRVARTLTDVPTKPATNTHHKHWMGLRGAGGGAFLRLKSRELEYALHKMPGIERQPMFKSGTHMDNLLYQEIGYVKLLIGDRTDTLVEVPVPVGSDWPVDKRVKEVQHRMTLLSQKDPLWWTRIKATQLPTTKEYVVSVPGAGYVITADQGFAHKRCCSPQELAQDLVVEIRNTFDPSPTIFVGMRGPNLFRAAQLVAEGDEAYANGQPDVAELKYRKATILNPNNAEAYMSLAWLYDKQQKHDAARQQLESALQIANLDEQHRQAIQKKLDSLSP